MSERNEEKMFKGVKYFVTGSISHEVRSCLEEGGAEKANFFSDLVTHCIVGDNPKDSDITDANELYEVPAVTPYWALLSSFCRKLLPTKGFIYDLRQVFYGMNLTASGISSADFKALWAMVTFYGGSFQSTLTRQCTHLISGSASGAKYEAALECPSIKIVTPDWIPDCIMMGHRPEEPYHPRYLLVPKRKEATPPLPGDLSTAQILGFADDPPVGAVNSEWSEQTPPPSTQALLEKLKQRMPWNKTGNSTPSTPPTPSFVTQKQTIQQSNTVVSMPSVQLPMQQSLMQQQQPPQHRLVPPQMLMEQPRMLRPPQVQQLAGAQMKQYRLIHPPQARMEVSTGQQITLQGQAVVQGQQQQQQQQTQLMQQPQQQLIQQGQPDQLQRPLAWAQGPPKPVQIQLDPQTHAQLSQMDPQQKMLFLQRIHQRQVLLQQQRHMQMQQQQQQQQQVVQQQQQQQQVVQQQVIQQQQVVQKQVIQQPVGQRPQQVALGGVPMQMRQQQIIIRGISPQQQTAWLQQQQFIRQQQMLVQQGGQIRPTVTSRVMQQQTAAGTWVPQADHQLQRQHQLRMQQVVIQRAPTPVQQFTQVTQVSTASAHAEEAAAVDQAPGGVGSGILVNNRTKTALANMLSSRLHTGHISPQPQQVMGVADSAAGQLRLMSAQQRAAQGPTPDTVVFSPGPGVQQQPRRTLGNITNSGPKSPAPAPTVPVPPKPQFYTHNPNHRIPVEKYLIGCVFYIVEYDKADSTDVNISAWEEIIRDHGGEVETNYTHRVTHVLCETQKHGIVQQALRDGKRCVTGFWLNDVVAKGSLSVPWLALHFPVPFGREKPLSKYHMSLTGFDDRTERDRVVLMIRAAGGQYRNYFSSSTHILICRKPEGPKYRKAKELNKMTVNVQWLNEVLFGHYSCIHQPELHKYQHYNTTSVFRVDYLLIPHLMTAWKMPISLTPEAYNAVKNSPPPSRRLKRARIELTLEQMKEAEAKILDAVPVVNIEMLTMETRPWVAITGDANLEYSKKAKQLGCFLVKSMSKVTHLVVCGAPVRTVKFLTCLITCKYVVKQDWLSDSAAQNRLLPEGPYLINSVDQEDFKCNIARVISSPDRNNLFKDKIFYLTPGVFPSRKSLSEMVELSGGRVEKQRRSIKAIQEYNRLDPTYFVVAAFNDLTLISDIFRASMDFYSTELIMRSISTQTLEIDSTVYKY